MSLASTAAEWTSGNNNIQRKRIPTIGRPVDRDRDRDTDIKLTIPESIEDTTARNVTMSSRVNTLLSQLSSDNDGNRLANYDPIVQPIPTINRSDVVIDLLPKNIIEDKSSSKFTSNDIDLANLSNYNQTYQTPPMYKPRGRSGEIEKDNHSLDNKLMDKINYMIHLLEEQQHEKTDNITEEFILYIMLGVFVIFTVDSFTRAGKYVR